MEIKEISIRDLTEYISRAKEMETGLHYIKKIGEDVESKIASLKGELNKLANKDRRCPEMPAPPEGAATEGYSITSIASTLLIVAMEIAIFSTYTLRLSSLRETLDRITDKTVWLLWILMIVFLILSIKSIRRTAEHISDVRDRNKRIKQNANSYARSYPERLESYNKLRQDYDAECRRDEKFIENITLNLAELKRIKAEVEEKIRRAEENKRSFYSVGIIYSSYQRLEPMSRFYEYFKSGRCDTLKEAMNTYDNEVMQKTIIDKIDDLTSAVYSIQYELSSISDTVDRGIRSISGTFDTMNERLGILNGSLNTQAYYAKITAECNKKIASDTDTLRFYENMRWIAGS